MGLGSKSNKPTFYQESNLLQYISPTIISPGQKLTVIHGALDDVNPIVQSAILSEELQTNLDFEWRLLTNGGSDLLEAQYLENYAKYFENCLRFSRSAE